jgi:hypothetical protein
MWRDDGWMHVGPLMMVNAYRMNDGRLHHCQYEEKKNTSNTVVSMFLDVLRG